MADEKKIVPEPQKPDKAAESEQPIMDKGGPPAPDKVTPTKAEVPTQKPLVENKAPIAPEKKEPEKEPVKPVHPEKPKEQDSIVSGKVVDFSAAQKEAEKPNITKKKEAPQAPGKKVEQEQTAAKPRRGRPPKVDKVAPDKAKPPLRDNMSQGKQHTPKDEKVSAAPQVSKQEQSTEPKDAARGVKEEIVYIDLDQLHAFKDHPFEVRDDTEMRSLAESVKVSGVNQPALVRPREGGGFEIIAGHRRQRASELAGFRNMPCIVRNMTDDEAILAMTDDNLRHREHILPMEKARALKQQVEAIKHQGARPGEDDRDTGKRSTEIVGERNGINYKQVQRYIRLNELVPDLQKMVDEKKISFTPAVEMSFIRPKNQKFIAVSIEGEQTAPSLSQAQKLRELDKEGKLNPDVIDGILSQQKKEVDKVIISAAELNKYFGDEKSPREMKEQIIALLDEWKAKQPPERTALDKKNTLEK